MNKSTMREQLQRDLQSLTVDQRRDKSARACRQLVATPAFQGSQVIMLFLSLPEEVDTTLALEAAWGLGKTVVVPRIRSDDRTLEAVIVGSLQDDFLCCSYGVRYPSQGEAIPLEQIDLVVTPGLGFDSQGNRLGRGAAFYDRFLQQAPLRAKRCGLAFEEQVVDVVPTVDHDQQVDCVVTDERVIVPDAKQP